MGALAEALAIHPSTATRMCDRLVAKRLVRRSPDPDNRRETVISLSDAGSELVDEVTAVRRREIAAIVARIPRDTRSPMVRALAAFAEAAGEPPPTTGTLGWA